MATAVKHKRRRRARRTGNAPKRLTYAFYSVVIIAVILFAAFVAELSYSNTLNHMIKNASIANPPIRFFVGASPNSSIKNLTLVPQDQIFCPENATIVNKSNEAFSYDYYTLLQPGSEFVYSFASNSSSTYTYATVEKPFSIVSYSSTTFNQSVCAGYPNARYAFRVIIKAPARYVGPIYINLYR
jgi:hypothetical protein